LTLGQEELSAKETKLQEILEGITGKVTDANTAQIFTRENNEIISGGYLRVVDFKYRFFFGLELRTSLGQIGQRLYAVECDGTSSGELRLLAAIFRGVPNLQTPGGSLGIRTAVHVLGSYLKENFGIEDSEVCTYLSHLVPFSDTHVRNLVRDRHPEWINSYRQENGKKASSRSSSARPSEAPTDGTPEPQKADGAFLETKWLDSDFAAAIHMASEKLDRDPYMLFHDYLLDGLTRDGIRIEAERDEQRPTLRLSLEKYPTVEGVNVRKCAKEGKKRPFGGELAHAHNGLRDKNFGWICAKARNSVGKVTTYDSRIAGFDGEVVKPSETLMHEVAHIQTPGHGHDAAWRNMMKELGQPVERRYQIQRLTKKTLCDHCGKQLYPLWRSGQGYWWYRRRSRKLRFCSSECRDRDINERQSRTK